MTDEALVHKIINELKSNSKGFDDIPLSYLNLAKPIVVPIIVKIINASFQLQHFPDIWKHALVKPLPKIKQPKLCNDYRPISILCTLSKIIEKVVYNQLSTHLENNNLLDPNQSGFRAGHSTQTTLLKLVDDVRLAMEQQKITLVVLFDFSKAFDLVDHTILLEKLKSLGCSNITINWFKSYLSGKKQAVYDDKRNVSTWCDILSGVPQGSNLGPSLFSVMINDICKVLVHSKYLLYADDFQIYIHGHADQLPRLIAMLTRDVRAVNDWAKANGLVLNAQKTKCMLIGSRHYTRLHPINSLPDIVVDGVRISWVKSAKNLGVIIDDNLSWNEHINSTVNKIWNILRQLKFNDKFLDRGLRRELVGSLVFPIIDYCCAVFTDLDDNLNSQLQRALNSCVRFIYKLRYDTHISPFLNELGWLNIQNRRKYFVAIQTYKLLYLKSPDYLRNIYRAIPDRQYHLRPRNATLLVPFCRTQFYKQSFNVTSTNLWNELPSQLLKIVLLLISSPISSIYLSFFFTNSNKCK